MLHHVIGAQCYVVSTCELIINKKTITIKIDRWTGVSLMPEQIHRQHFLNAKVSKKQC